MLRGEFKYFGWPVGDSDASGGNLDSIGGEIRC